MFDKSEWDNMSDYQAKAFEAYILDLLKELDNEIREQQEMAMKLRALLYEFQLYIIARNN